ncbi:MAG: alpha/beta hydrolase [Rhodobacteraceae bacterium]|nr:alpha/beta hydrolase [Paracoccaceae bacterium]
MALSPLAALAAAAGLVALPFAAETLRRPAHRRRGAAPGRFADLPSGWTHYRWWGAAEGPVAVLIHGLTTPSFVWEGLAPLLAAKGWRCLAYDLHGRGFSAAVPGRQDADFFLRQLRGLLDHQGLGGPVTLVGYSMGGAIATAFAARHPDRVARLVLVAPAGLGHRLSRLERLVERTPLLGDWLMLVFGGINLRANLRRLLGARSSVPDIAARQIAETRARGFLPAVLSSQRHMLAADQSGPHRRIAAAGLPVAAVWGDADAVIPLEAKERLAALNPAARQVVVAGATHGLPHTHPEAVAALF